MSKSLLPPNYCIPIKTQFLYCAYYKWPKWEEWCLAIYKSQQAQRGNLGVITRMGAMTRRFRLALPPLPRGETQEVIGAEAGTALNGDEGKE